MSAWIGILGTIVGALLAGGAAWVNARFQISRQDERDRRKLILGKLEELHETLTHVKRHHSEFAINQMMQVASRSTLKPADLPPQRSPIEKMYMLVGFYAPELGPLAKELGKAFNNFGALIEQRLSLHLNNNEAVMKCLGEFRDKGFVVTRICDEMQGILILISKKYV